MYLFIDTLSEPTYICIFDETREIIGIRTWTGKQREFDTLTEEIDDLLLRNDITYEGLSGIVVMVGPGGFTGTRVTTLVANTIGYSFDTPLFPLTVNEFFSYQKASLPWITAITKKEVLLWNTDASSATITLIHELPEGKYNTLAPIDFTTPYHTIVIAKEHSRVIRSLPLSKAHKRISPIYARDPNITLKKTYAS